MPRSGADDRAAPVGGSGRRAPDRVPTPAAPARGHARPDRSGAVGRRSGSASAVRLRRTRVLGTCVAAAALIVGCAPAERPAPTAAPAAAPTPTSATRAPAATGSAASEPNRDPEHGGPITSVAVPAPKAAPIPSRRPAGRAPVVVLDPGHNGGNAADPEVVSRPVEAGHGRTKPCNTLGTSTPAGYPEHAFTWDVALRARTLLAARGVKVVLTRPDDRGVGPCVDVRGRFGNKIRADAVVSVHADGVEPAGSGFHVIEAARAPGGPAVAGSSHRLALAVRKSLRSGSGLPYASYAAGGDGLDARDDLAGLNLSTRPSVVVECGNMRNPADAAVLSAAAGRRRIAAALAAGLLAYLSGR